MRILMSSSIPVICSLRLSTALFARVTAMGVITLWLTSFRAVLPSISRSRVTIRSWS